MRPLSAAELLSVWERSMDLSLLRKTLLLLDLACPEMDESEITLFSIGERDARLFKIREWMFGSRFRNTIDCPQCGRAMEWEMNTEDFNLAVIPDKWAPEEYELNVNDFSIRFRLPNSQDISEILLPGTSNQESDHLLQNCILEIKQKNRKYSQKTLPEKVSKALASKIEELDPAADIRIGISCPDCSHKWEAPFDIMSYLWSEINNWAQRMLQDIYLLAKTFGWAERDILNMDATRRQLYVEMIRS